LGKKNCKILKEITKKNKLKKIVVLRIKKEIGKKKVEENMNKRLCKVFLIRIMLYINNRRTKSGQKIPD
jgi:hypothetical protein